LGQILSLNFLACLVGDTEAVLAEPSKGGSGLGRPAQARTVRPRNRRGGSSAFAHNGPSPAAPNVGNDCEQWNAICV